MTVSKDITYGKTEKKCRINWEDVTLFLTSAQPSGDLEVGNSWVYKPGL